VAPELGFQTGSGKEDQDNAKGEEGALINFLSGPLSGLQELYF